MISTLLPQSSIRHDEQDNLKQYVSSTSSSSTTASLTAGGPKAKVRKKSQQLHRTPYDNNAINSGKIIKLKTISNGSKRPTPELIGNFEGTPSSNLSDFTVTNNGIAPMETDDIQGSHDSMHSETNYEITLKQQQLFLQWQEVRALK